MKKHLGKSLTLAILLSVCGGYTMFGLLSSNYKYNRTSTVFVFDLSNE